MPLPISQLIMGNRTEGCPIIRWATFRPRETLRPTNGRKVARSQHLCCVVLKAFLLKSFYPDFLPQEFQTI